MTQQQWHGKTPSMKARRSSIWPYLLVMLALFVSAFVGYSFLGSNRLIGKYQDQYGLMTLQFKSDGTCSFDSDFDRAKTVQAKYTLSGNHFTLDLSNGAAASDPQVADNPIYKILANSLSGDVSDDRKSLTFNDVTFYRKD